MFGKNITKYNDELTKISVKIIYDKIRNPDPEFAQLIASLRSLSVLDPESYRKQKKILPYVVPSIFNPPFRRRENFGYSDQLILDFDHLSYKNLSPDKVKDKLSADDRVELIFTSPGGDGVKVFFKLNKRITDYSQYSSFYKIFASEFAQSYGMSQVFDSRTSDVTRACFLSVDLFAYYNPNASAIEVEQVVDFENIFEVKQKEKQVEKGQKALVKTQPKPVELSPDSDTLIEIKKKLNPNYVPRTKKQKKYFVPEELNIAEKKIRDAVKKYDIQIINVKNINYGKQFLFQYKEHKAEINLFYGKKGFSIVKTVRNFNNEELQNIMVQIIDQAISGFEANTIDIEI